MLRYLRIAVTALSLTACGLLIALWVRSYNQLEARQLWGHDVWALSGTVIIDDTWVPGPTSPLKSSSYWEEQSDGNIVSGELTFQTLVPAGTGITIPFWLLTIVLFLLAAIPWLPWRFSLRTLLIATTLVAAGLGVVVYLAA